MKSKVVTVQNRQAVIFFLFAAMTCCGATSSYLVRENHVQRRLAEEEDSALLELIQTLLSLTSTAVNLLKIAFQLTTLLFLITDLVNFWGLASIYIFVPIQLPEFTERVLKEAWGEFNQSILSYLGISFDIINLQNSEDNAQYQDRGYENYLSVDVSEVAFQPLMILVITVIELTFLSWLLNRIKAKFRLIRRNFQKSHQKRAFKTKNLETKQLPTTRHSPKLAHIEIINQNQLVETKEINQGQARNIKRSQNAGSEQEKQEQESYKCIFLASEPSQFSQQQEQTVKAKLQFQRNRSEQSCKQNTKLRIKKLDSLQNRRENFDTSDGSAQRPEGHWSQDINVEKIEIVSALLISFMPVLFLPLFGTYISMKQQSLKSKANLLLYYTIIGVLLIYPLVYLMMKTQSIQVKSTKSKKTELYRKENSQPNRRKPPRLQKIRFKTHLEHLHLETFFVFLMNLSIPILAGIQSSALPFLIGNSILHCLLLFSEISLSKDADNCDERFKKVNNFVHKLTFSAYHCCFFLLYLFNQMKQGWVEAGFLSESQVQRAFSAIGVTIVMIFALGGLHEILEFIVVTAKNLFKLIYMILRICLGGYDVSDVEIFSRSNRISNFSGSQPNQKSGMLQQPSSCKTITQNSLELDVEILNNTLLLEHSKLQRQRLLEEEQSNNFNRQSMTCPPKESPLIITKCQPKRKDFLEVRLPQDSVSEQNEMELIEP